MMLTIGKGGSMSSISCYDPPRRIHRWVSCMILAFGGLFGLAQAYAFDLVVTSLGGGVIAEFTYLINEDNTGNPSDPNPMKHPSVAPMASHSPIVAAGREDTATGISLPAGRYL